VTAFRLAHLSDPHLPPPAGALDWRDGVSKRLLSSVAWRRKGDRHLPAILAALVADLQAYDPDHIAITGDLTNFATAAEFAGARAWLEALGPASKITVSPGNHDALVGPDAAARFQGWRSWLGDGEGAAFPYVRLREGVALINLCSATPTAPWLATGRLGGAQIGRLSAALSELAGTDVFKVALIHHPPARGVVAARKSLEDGEALRAALKIQGVDLILHGHAHEAVTSTIEGPGGPIPVLGVPSASGAPGQRHPAARWHALEITRRDGGAEVRVAARSYDAASASFVACGAYALATPQRG